MEKLFYSKWIRRFICGLIVSALPCFTIILMGPLEIYNANNNELEFGIGDFIGWLLLIFVFLTLLGGIFALIPKIGDFAIIVLFWGGISSYIQVMFLNGSLHMADGNKIYWRDYSKLTVINAIIWLFIFLLVVFVYMLKKLRFRILCFISAFIVLIQLIAAIFIISKCGIGHTPEKMQIMDASCIYDMGSEDNIVLFIVDSFSNWDFEELLSDKPESERVFCDFVYYNNDDSIYAATFPSLLHMVTGSDPDYTISCREWKKRAWNSKSCNDFYSRMHEKGYSCELFSINSIGIVGNLSNASGKIDNLVENKTYTNSKRLVDVLMKMSFYRAAPYRFKDFFEQYTDPFANCVGYDNPLSRIYNYDFFDGLMEEGLRISGNKKYKIIHIDGTHAPYQTSKECTFVEEATREDVREGIVYMLEEYFEQMKELGVYDNSTIIITADHGASALITEECNNFPILLYKERAFRGDSMRISDSPVSHDDLMATVLYCAGIDGAEFGETIFDWEGKRRQRVYTEQYEGLAYNFVGDRYELYRVKQRGEGYYIGATNDWY